MKILMVNKYLYPKGGAETYFLKLGEYYKNNGHEVEYFGMDDIKRTVSNSANAYTKCLDFHSAKADKIFYPFRIIYSKEAKDKMKNLLEVFKPDVIHLNNFNFQLTPSIIVAVDEYKKTANKKVKLVLTAHDYQLICPNHLMNNPNTRENCEKCVGQKFMNCTKGKCIHGSRMRSIIGTIEASYWNRRNIYESIDLIICPSNFLAGKMQTNPIFHKKTVTLHNFIDDIPFEVKEKKDYVLYFGRYYIEKGIENLLKVCESLPEIPFIFAGSGPLEEQINQVKNIKNVGFQTGKDLENLIREARFSIYTSEWYENCPFSVMESQMYGTPVIGANIGGIPELILPGETGELYESGNNRALRSTILSLWNDKQLTDSYSENCKLLQFDTISIYADKLMKLYTK